MKKKLTIIVSLLLSTAIIASCGSSKNDSAVSNTQPETETTTGEPIALTMSWWGNQVRNEGTQKVIDLYESENPSVTIEGQFSPWGDYWNKLATLSAGQAMPDIAQMDYSYLNQYVANDLLVDLTTYTQDGTLNVSNINETSISSGKIGDGLYAIPAGLNAPSLLYNKTLLEENDIEIKDYMSMEEFFDVSREVYEKTGYKTNVSYYGGVNYLEYYMRANDIVVFEDGKINGTPEDYVAFFDIYESGLEEGWHIQPQVFTELTVGTVEQDPMIYGSSPDTMSWCSFPNSNQFKAYQSAAPEGMEVGITTYPSADPTKSLYLKSSMFFSVGINSKNPQEAAKVIDFFTNSEAANDILLSERGVPPSSVISESQAPKLTEVEQEVVRYINEVVTPNCSPINPPSPEGTSEASTLFNQVLEQLCYGNYDAETAANEFYTGAQAIMSSK